MREDRVVDSVTDYYREHPVAESRYTRTLAAAAERVAHGEDLRFAVREVLDELRLRPTAELRRAAIAGEPKSIGARGDALLAAVAEHAALVDGAAPPAWALSPSRFLDRMWFVSETPGFRAIALRDAPAAFRRRGVFLPVDALRRV
jgi:hypothetical protein